MTGSAIANLIAAQSCYALDHGLRGVKIMVENELRPMAETEFYKDLLLPVIYFTADLLYGFCFAMGSRIGASKKEIRRSKSKKKRTKETKKTGNQSWIIGDNKELVNKYLSSVDEEIIEDQFLKDYYESLTNGTKEICEKINIRITEDISSKFKEQIITKYKMKKVEEIERIDSRVTILFKDTLIRRISEEFKFRDDSLINMCKESFNKYLNLNKRINNN